MITITPVLRVGQLKKVGMGGFQVRDSYDFALKDWDDPYAVDNLKIMTMPSYGYMSAKHRIMVFF